MNTALLIIDVQQGLCEGAHEAFESQQVIARINTVAAKARAPGALVIFIQHESTSGYLERGTDAWQLARGLQLEPADLRLRKTTPDSFHRTELENILKRHKTNELVVCGMQPSSASTPPRAGPWRWATRSSWSKTDIRLRATPICRPRR
jgi:nicotinamidase-related amidase